MTARAAVAALALAAAAAPCALAALSSSIVGLDVTYQEWDQRRPWIKEPPRAREAVAVVVRGPYLLTTAQMLASATFVKVSKFGRPTRAVPRVAFLDAEADLALLAVDDPAFFADLAPVALAPRTPTTAALRTARWDGQQLEIAATRFKSARVEGVGLGNLEHLFVEVQTDLTGGGWGEPVFAQDALVGLTVSQEKDQRARVIPVEIVAPFLRRAAAPRYERFPILGAAWQANVDPALAAYLGQSGEPRGVIIRQVPWGSTGCGVLEPRDILLAIDGVAIDAEGYYAHPYLGYLRFPQLLVDRHVEGDRVRLTVLRGGRTLELEATLRPYPPSFPLVPEAGGLEPPPYAIVGGLVLRELDSDYLRSWGNEWRHKAPKLLQALLAFDKQDQRPERRRIVILSTVLPLAYNVGYQDLANLPVESVNGHPVASLADAVAALEAPRGGFDEILLVPNGQRRRIVLDAAGLAAATKEALDSLGVPEAVRLPERAPPASDAACPPPAPH